MNPAKQIPSELKDRFEDVVFLGRGGQGLTFRAIRKFDQKDVVLKVLDFLELSSWKNYDLFLREIAILKTLDHDAIPKVLEVYPESTHGEEPDAVVLVQEYFGGNSLKELLDGDEPWSEEDVRGLLDQVLDILAYLHDLNPPVVHRDIKPSNIIRRLDGSFALIDFGAASATQKTNASTFVGTNGYMAPEQMMGRAEPRSDLYSLGATALHLATGIHPTNLAREDFSFRLDGLGLEPGLVRVLERLVHSHPEKRFRDATQVKHALQPSQELVLASVDEAGFHLVRHDDETKIDFPGPPLFQVFMLCAASIFFTALIWANPSTASNWIFLCTLGGSGIYYLIRRRRIFIDEHSIRYVNRLGPFSRTKTWRLDEIVDVRSQKRGAFLDVVLQDQSASRHSVGWGFTNGQAQWLVRQIGEELEERR